MSRENILIQIGKRIRQLRSEKKLSQSELSKKAGVTQGAVSEVEAGKRAPGPQFILSVSRSLGVSTDYLLAGEHPMPPELVVQTNPIALSKADQFVPVPLVDERVAAGPASEIGEEDVKDWVVVHRPTVGKKADLVAVRIRGDSMEPVLPNGAIVIVDRNDRTKIKKGRIYIVRIDGGVTAKYLERDGEELILVAENREYRDQRIKIREGEDSPIVGSVIWKWQSMG